MSRQPALSIADLVRTVIDSLAYRYLPDITGWLLTNAIPVDTNTYRPPCLYWPLPNIPAVKKVCDVTLMLYHLVWFGLWFVLPCVPMQGRVSTCIFLSCARKETSGKKLPHFTSDSVNEGSIE